MPRPVVHATTERLYGRLPGHYRATDEAELSGGGWPLLRFLSLVLDQVGALEDLLERIAYVPPEDGGQPGDTSDLVDPDAADAAWLEWLSQLVGVPWDPALTIAQRRDAIRTAAGGWRAGTKDGIRLAAQTVLAGTKFAQVLDHYQGNPWRIAVQTMASETPSTAAVVDAVNRLRAKPAGYELVVPPYAASWATLVADFPTWATLNGLTWQQRQEAM